MTRAATLYGSIVGLAIALGAIASSGRGATTSDPIADDVARWKRYLGEDTVSVGFVAQVKRSAAPALASADDALAKGRRAFALLRLGNVRANLEPGLYPATHAHPTFDELDAERAKLAPRFDAKAIATLAHPAETSALGRALAEASAMQAKETFDASDAYGRATEPLFGLYYLAQGVAYLDYADFAAKAGASLRPNGARAPKLRSLAPEIRTLRDEMLAAYKPPLSIDRHPEYIGASGATKEALEYDAAGLYEAALLRYLQAAVRFAPLRADRTPLDAATLAAKTEEWRKRLADAKVDHSIGTLFLEVAAGDADTARAGNAVVASAVVEDVLPRYIAALAPTAPTAAAKPPEVTVTLVRWPYT
jgi:hypothetical protein